MVVDVIEDRKIETPVTTASAGKILVVDDEEPLARILSRELQRFDYLVDTATGGKEACAMVQSKPYDVMILDLKMPDISGIRVLREVRKAAGPPEVIILTGHATVESALAAMKLGAFDYLLKPFKLSELNQVIRKALEKRSLISHIQPPPSHPEVHQIIYCSEKMDQILRLIRKISSSEATVLITGESGTGKELIAHEIHSHSLRSKGPMIALNCSAFQDTLLESELFGHEKGAFTGADQCKPGLFELANGGSIFFDEIGDLSLRLQGKILRALESKSFFRVGGTRSVNVDPRVLGATNTDLRKLIGDKAFREDLYYRLSTIVIHLPPLRERKEDIEILCGHFLKMLVPDRPFSISGRAMDMLMAYDWPGNIRELKNVIERAILVSSHEVIEPSDICPDISASAIGRGGAPDREEKDLVSLEVLEKRQILKALNDLDWHRGKAARALGISQKTLYRKIKAFNIHPSRELSHSES